MRFHAVVANASTRVHAPNFLPGCGGCIEPTTPACPRRQRCRFVDNDDDSGDSEPTQTLQCQYMIAHNRVLLAPGSSSWSSPPCCVLWVRVISHRSDSDKVSGRFMGGMSVHACTPACDVSAFACTARFNLHIWGAIVRSSAHFAPVATTTTEIYLHNNVFIARSTGATSDRRARRRQTPTACQHATQRNNVGGRRSVGGSTLRHRPPAPAAPADFVRKIQIAKPPTHYSRDVRGEARCARRRSARVLHRVHCGVHATMPMA